MLSLNYRDARPIYEQVKDGLRHLVVTGAIQAGDKLPSVRALASSLAINPNTIQRAYEALEREGYLCTTAYEHAAVLEPCKALEREGYLCTVAGKGSFAAERGGINTVRRDALLRQFDAAASELLFLGLTPEELSARLRAAKGKEMQA